MFDTPLTEAETDRLNQLLFDYGHDDSILCLSELDGFLTALVSGPNAIMPNQWLPAIWGGITQQPQWQSPTQMQEFMQLVMRHMNGIVDGLMHAPSEFEALFNYREVDGKTHIIVEEWCFGYMRGVSLDNGWAQLPQSLAQDFDLLRLHGTEGGFESVARMSEAQMAESIRRIEPAVRRLHAYWLSQRAHLKPPMRPQAPPMHAAVKVGRNDPCPCGSGKKFKQCCLH